MDITQHPDILRISNALNEAMSQVKDAASQGDTVKATELTAKYRQLEDLYSQRQNELVVAKNEEKDRSLQWLASTPSAEELSSIGTQESFAKAGTDIPAVAAAGAVKRAVSALKSDEDIRNNIAFAYDIPKDQIDTKSGLTGTHRWNVSLHPTPESKLQYLQQEYGPENITPVNISGSPSFLVKIGKNHVLADELGTSFSDFTADIAGEIPVLAGNIAGGMAAARIGKGAGASPVAAGAALGGLAAGAVQDVVARSVSGMPIDPVEIARRRGLEAALGYGIDKFGQILLKPFVKKIGGNITNKMASSIEDARKLLAGQEVETTAPIMNIFGREALEAQKERMGRQATGIGSRAGSAAERTLDLLGQFRQKLQGEDIPLDYERIIGAQKAQEADIINQIAKYDAQGAKIVEDNLKKKFDELATKDFSKRVAGESIQENLMLARKNLVDIKDASYNDFFRLANQVPELTSTTPREVADALERGLSKAGERTNPEIVNQIAEMRARQDLLDKAADIKLNLEKTGGVPNDDEAAILAAAAARPNLDLKMLRDRVRIAQEAGISGPLMGARDTSAEAAALAVSELDALSKSKIKAAGLDDAWNKGTENLNNALGSRRQAAGRVLAEQYGDFKKTGVQTVDDIIRDPQYIQDAIELSSLSGDPATAELTRKGLQDAYLSKLGLTTSKGNMSGKLDINDDIVKSLWQTVDENGKPNLLAANKISEKLRNLNNAFQQSKVDMKNIDPSDVKKLFSTLSSDDEKAVIESIKSRSSAQNAKDLFTSNSIIKAASKGNWDVTDSTKFTDALFNADVGEVSRLLKRLPASVKPSVQSDFVGRLFKDYPTTAETTNATELFDAKAVLEDLSGPKGKQMESRIKEVMGKNWFDSFKAAATVMDANMFAKSTDQQIGYKMSGGGTGGSRFFFVGNPVQIAKDRLVSGAQGLGVLEPMFRLMAKQVSRETVDRNWGKALQGISGTRAGIMALTHAVRDDPNEAQRLSDFYTSTAKQGGSMSERFKANMGK